MTTNPTGPTRNPLAAARELLAAYQPFTTEEADDGDWKAAERYYDAREAHAAGAIRLVEQLRALLVPGARADNTAEPGDPQPAPGVHVWVDDTWGALATTSAGGDGSVITINDNTTGAPLAAMTATSDGIRMGRWDDDGRYVHLATVPYLHLGDADGHDAGPAVDPVDVAAHEAGAPVMGATGVLGIIRGRGGVPASALDALTPDDVAALYARHVGPAIDRVEDEVSWKTHAR